MKYLSIFTLLLCSGCKSFDLTVSHPQSGLTATVSTTKPTLKAIDPAQVTEKDSLAWDAPTQNVDGSPLTDLDHYVIALSAPDADLNSGGNPLATAESNCATAACELVLKDLLSGIADGPYRAWVRAVDTAGNESLWSVPLDIPVNNQTPGPATNLTIKKYVVNGTFRAEVVEQVASTP